ncbi:MAG TPA: radical SAM protein [Myxococcales bacterium]|jgi:radical SAM superfamily enzyme YgiQ (UPF0313 family)
MKILLVYPNLGGPVGFHIGLAHLSGALKAHSHEVRLFHLNADVGFPLDLERVAREALDFAPDLVGITACTEEIGGALAVARQLKSRVRADLPIVLGGVHATLNADEMIGHEELDLVVVGEGEHAIVDIAAAIQQGRDPAGIENVWARRDGKIVRNRLRPLAQLDELPPMDLELFDVQRLTQIRNGWVDVMWTRGCLYQCTYCFNKAFRDQYARNGSSDHTKNYRRSMNPERFIQGLRSLIAKNPGIKAISFVDDDFPRAKGCEEMLGLLHEQIGLPFMINAHPGSVDEAMAKKLKEAGCDLVRVGLESGRERIRKQILGRPMPDAALVASFARIRAAGLRLQTYNMIGLPTESREDMLATLELNARCHTDVVKVMTFIPFPGTELHQTCGSLGLLPEAGPVGASVHGPSVLRLPDELRLFQEKALEYPDCYLNSLTEGLADRYRPLLSELDGMPREQWDRPEVRASFNASRDALSAKLLAEKVDHYAIRFSHFAVRLCGGKDVVATA